MKKILITILINLIVKIIKGCDSMNKLKKLRIGEKHILVISLILFFITIIPLVYV